MLKVMGIESTPNPHADKFVLNETILKEGSRQYNNAGEAVNDNLAKGIFDIEGVASVFYTENFITIEKSRSTDWDRIKEPLKDFLGSFDPEDIPRDIPAKTHNADENELLKEISSCLEEKVLPALANDGGGIEIVKLDGKTLTVHYQGACGSCPSATRGTLFAIESLLRRDVDPQIKVVPN